MFCTLYTGCVHVEADVTSMDNDLWKGNDFSSIVRINTPERSDGLIVLLTSNEL